MAKGIARAFTPTNPEKYKGDYPIIARSRWETDFMKHLDLNPNVLEWASEPVQIPYRDPLTGTQKVYIPDFLVVILNKNKTVERKLIEIKPMKEHLSEFAQTRGDAALQARNRAKWGAAETWCLRRGITFAILNESNLYSGYENVKGRIHPIKQYAPAQTKKVKLKVPKPTKRLTEETPIAKRFRAMRRAVTKARVSKVRSAKKA